MIELSKTFDPKSAEEHWFQLWIDLGYFKVGSSRPLEQDANGASKVFSIVIPPPNVTGQLHLGHALNVTLQDVIVRTRRMQGYNTLWIPGTDHAGIATQNVVERDLAKEKKTRHDLGREQFVTRIWEWKGSYGGRITHQLRRLGASCDWGRERFTLDPGLSRAVTRVFVSLYRDGLVYRARRIINWCPRCETALSDLEVEHKETQGHLWYIKYPLTDGSGVIIVATTRPETMLGDTAIAVHPEDPRYRALVGKQIRLPLMGREVPIIADASVDQKFGSGAVKVTPAHDASDFALSSHHNLAQISIIDTHTCMNANAFIYQGLTREECRTRVVADLEVLGLLERVESHSHAVGVCSRCDAIIEPMLSFQWFININKPGPSGRSLVEEAIIAVEDGRTTFHPKFWETTYFAWMHNLQDWCVSRQLWWGHRIPAYWCERCPDAPPIVSEERPRVCPKCGGSDIRQDDDVLDTWFSSGLWPFSTLGWPDATPELARYYPTSLLITGFDIIFFWVARMMMLSLYCMQDRPDPAARVPFRNVYITPLVRDQYGKKMSKSRGNVVDPLEIMEKYGTDAVRFTLAQLAVQGRDLILSDERLRASRTFTNKVWNAARFVLMNLEGVPQPLPSVNRSQLELADCWILSRLDAAVCDVTTAIDTYEFNRAALVVYQFIWHEFCDWYIEISKKSLKVGSERRMAVCYVLTHCLDGLLRILHPFMPFITEEVWQVLRPYLSEAQLGRHLVVTQFPTPSSTAWLTADETLEMQRCMEATEAINSFRALLGWHPEQRIKAFIREADSSRPGSGIFTQWKPYVMTLAKLACLEPLGQSARPPVGFYPLTLEWGEVSVNAPTGFDQQKARLALEKKLKELTSHQERHNERLKNPEFLTKASAKTQSEMRDRKSELDSHVQRMQEQLAQLGAGDL